MTIREQPLVKYLQLTKMTILINYDNLIDKNELIFDLKLLVYLLVD